MQPPRYQPLESLLLAAEMHTSAASQMLDPRDTSAPNKISAPSSASLSCCKDEPCFAPSSLPPIASSLYKQEILPTLEHLLRGASLKMMLDPYRSVGSMPGLPSLHLLPLDKSMLQGGAFPQVSLSMADGSAQVVRPLAQLATCSVVLNNSMEIAEHRNIIHQLLNQTLGITAASNTIMSEPRATQSASLPEKRKMEEEGSSASGGINYAQCLKKPRSGEENAAYMLQQTLKKDASSHQSALFKLEHRFVSRKRLGIVHDRRGRLREVEDLFLDCPLMRPYIEMGYSAQVNAGRRTGVDRTVGKAMGVEREEENIREFQWEEGKAEERSWGQEEGSNKLCSHSYPAGCACSVRRLSWSPASGCEGGGSCVPELDQQLGGEGGSGKHGSVHGGKEDKADGHLDEHGVRSW
eukprot:760167-Hanusia_phi.AAC.7